MLDLTISGTTSDTHVVVVYNLSGIPMHCAGFVSLAAAKHEATYVVKYVAKQTNGFEAEFSYSIFAKVN